jgi:hypothetical protein
MPTICQNCLRPVRVGAKYCGFCGTSLTPSTEAEPVPAAPVPQDQAVAEVISDFEQRTEPKNNKVGQRVLIIVVIVLLLVIFLTLILNFWPNISAFLIQSFPFLKIR